MLKKLLKYEIRATARLFLPVFGAILLLAILNNIFFNFNDIPDFAAVLTMMLYVILIIALFVLVYVVMIQRFYKNLLRDEGYLMFTLPVRTWQLIASKLIVSIMWLAICTFVTVLSVFIMAFSLDLLREIPEFLRQLSDFLAHYVGISEVTLFFEFVFLMLIGTAVNNGIYLVDGTNQLRQTMPLGDALVEAGTTRLRPILMTTLTTIISMVPMMFSNDSGMGMMKDMAYVMVGGLVASTILAMFLMPAFYLLIRRENVDGTKRGRKHKQQKIEAGAAQS